MNLQHNTEPVSHAGMPFVYLVGKSLMSQTEESQWGCICSSSIKGNPLPGKHILPLTSLPGMAQGCLAHYGWAAFTYNPSCYWQWPNKAALDTQEFEKLWKADWFRSTWQPAASQAKTPIHLQRDWNPKFFFTQTNEHQLSAKRRIHSLLVQSEF